MLIPSLGLAASVDFEEAQKIALSNNLSIRAAYSTIEQARGRLLQSGLWPNPEIDLAYRSDVFFGGDGQDRITAALMQRMPWSGRLAKAQTVSRVEVAIALTEVRNEERLLLLEVQKAFIEAQTASEKSAVLQKLAKSVDALISLNQLRLQAGQLFVISVNLAKIEKEGIRQQLVTLQSDEAIALARLKGLLGMKTTQQLALKDSLSSIINKLKVSTAGKTLYRPDLVRTSLEADAAVAEIALARAEVWEDITVGVEYEFERTLDGDEGLINENYLGLRVVVPLPAWNRNQGRVAEQSAGRERAQQTLLAAKLSIEAEISVARVEGVKSAQVATMIQKDSLPLLNETRGVLEEAIKLGQADTAEAITLTRQEIEQRLFYVEALAKQAQALSGVEAALGGNPRLQRDIFINTLHEKKPSQKH